MIFCFDDDKINDKNIANKKGAIPNPLINTANPKKSPAI